MVAIWSPSRSIVPVADQRGPPPCGTSIVVSARTCRTSPAASSRGEVQPRLGGEEVGVTRLGEREREIVEVAAAEGERGRGGIAEDRELGLDVGDHAARARSAGRGSAAVSARRRGRASSTSRAVGLPASPAAAATPARASRACDAWTSSGSRAASSGYASSAVSAGQASVSARSAGRRRARRPSPRGTRAEASAGQAQGVTTPSERIVDRRRRASAASAPAAKAARAASPPSSRRRAAATASAASGSGERAEAQDRAARGGRRVDRDDRVLAVGARA